jgi:hypothetical protein
VGESDNKHPKADEQQQQPGRITRSEDFENLYANNFMVEATVWDLKVLFGQLMGDDQGGMIELHTGMIMPWTLVKILAFHLALNVIAFENQNGPVRLAAPSVPLISNLTARSKADPRIMAIFTALMAVGNPEIFAPEGPGTPKPAEDPTEKPESNAT